MLELYDPFPSKLDELIRYDSHKRAFITSFIENNWLIYDNSWSVVYRGKTKQQAEERALRKTEKRVDEQTNNDVQ